MRRALDGPKPQASTAGATVTSKAPPVAALTSRASANTSSVSRETATALPAGAALKRASSEESR